MANVYNSNHTGQWHDNQPTIEEILNLIYPIGSVYITINNVNPGTLFGGTWEQIEDKFLLCAGSTYAAGTSGGAASATSGEPSNNLSGSTAITVDQMPSHTHEMPDWIWATSTNFNTGTFNIEWKDGRTGNAVPYYGNKTDQQLLVTYTGSGQGHTHTLSSHTHDVSILPPYLAVYVWKRIS